MVLYSIEDGLPFGIFDWFQEWCHQSKVPIHQLSLKHSLEEISSLIQASPSGVLPSSKRLPGEFLDQYPDLKESQIRSLIPWASRWEHYNLGLCYLVSRAHEFALKHDLITLCGGHPGLIHKFLLKQRENPFWHPEQFKEYLQELRTGFLKRNFPDFDLDEIEKLAEQGLQVKSNSNPELLNQLKSHLILEDTQNGYSLHPLFLKSPQHEAEDQSTFWMSFDQRIDFGKMAENPEEQNRLLHTYQEKTLSPKDCWNQLLAIRPGELKDKQEQASFMELAVEVSQFKDCPMPYTMLILLKNLANQEPDLRWRQKFQLILMDYYLLHSSRLELEKLLMDRYTQFCELGEAEAMCEFLFREGIHHYLSDLHLLGIHLVFSAFEITRNRKARQYFHCYSLLMSLCQPHCDWGIGLREMESGNSSSFVVVFFSFYSLPWP